MVEERAVRPTDARQVRRPTDSAQESSEPEPTVRAARPAACTGNSVTKKAAVQRLMQERAPGTRSASRPWAATPLAMAAPARGLSGEYDFASLSGARPVRVGLLAAYNGMRLSLCPSSFYLWS